MAGEEIMLINIYGLAETGQRYTWNESRGILLNGEQILQFVVGGSGTKKFRTQCGKLLVKALNGELIDPNIPGGIAAVAARVTGKNYNPKKRAK